MRAAHVRRCQYCTRPPIPRSQNTRALAFIGAGTVEQFRTTSKFLYELRLHVSMMHQNIIRRGRAIEVSLLSVAVALDYYFVGRAWSRPGTLTSMREVKMPITMPRNNQVTIRPHWNLQLRRGTAHEGQHLSKLKSAMMYKHSAQIFQSYLL